MRKNEKKKGVKMKLKLPKFGRKKIDKDLADRQANAAGAVGWTFGYLLGFVNGITLGNSN